jgi:acyl transferase domain-containing protein
LRINTFIELGPHSSLLSYVKKVGGSINAGLPLIIPGAAQPASPSQGSAVVTVNTLRRNEDESMSLYSALAALYCRGFDLICGFALQFFILNCSYFFA